MKYKVLLHRIYIYLKFKSYKLRGYPSLQDIKNKLINVKIYIAK